MYKMNRKQDVGDPCLTPMAVVIMTVPSILWVTLYITPIAVTIIAPYPRRFKTDNKIDLGTRS